MRTASVSRKTKETDIEVTLNLDGAGTMVSDIPIPFLQHLLEQIAKHGFLDMEINAAGDIEIDGHHTTEDLGIVLGQAVKQALGDKKGIRRYGSTVVPMDETLAMCAVDISGRPYLHFDAVFTTPRLGDLDTELIREFFQALSVHAELNLHLKILHGTNNHHMAEALFKAFGRAMSEAVAHDPRVKGVPSTKGML